jgi:predicted permease
MQGAAIVLLAIASFNAANLLLLLAANRRKEIAIRAAAGASPGRLLRLFLAESLALAGLAAAAGTGLAFAALRILAPLSPASLLRAGEASLDWRSLSSIVLVSLAAAVAAGAPPALSVWRLRLRDALAQTAVSRRRAVSRASTACAVAGLALALPLSLSAGLILRSFQKLSQTDPGFRAQGVLVFHLVGAPEPANCASCDSRQRTLTLRERVRALPGAEAVANSEAVPLEGFRTDWRFALEPASLRDPARLHSALWNGVSEDYFRVLGIPLRRGREFQPSSDRRRQNVIVNEELARRCFPGQDALGRTLFHESGRPFQIVGVAGNVRSERLELAAQPEVYLYGGGISLSVRYRGDPAALQRAVRDLLQSEGGGLILAETTPLERFLNNGTARLRLWTVLLGALTGCSLCLAAAGVYALVACSTRRRVAEFGLRMALGARRTDIFLLVLRDTLRLAGAGILLGVLGAAAASSLVSHLLFEVRPWDPPAAAASVLALTLVSLAASLPAARSASRVEPRQALSAE